MYWSSHLVSNLLLWLTSVDIVMITDGDAPVAVFVQPRESMRLLMSHVFAKRAEPTPVITALDKPRYLDALQEADRGALRAFVQMLETKAVEGPRYATRSIENMLEGRHSYFHMNGDLSTRSPENGWTRHHGTNGRESVIEVDAAVTSGAAAGRRTRRGRRRSASHRPSVNERPT